MPLTVRFRTLHRTKWCDSPQAARSQALEAEAAYELTSLNDLLDHASISRQSLYNIFGGKEELFQPVLGHYFETRMAPNLQGMEAPDVGVFGGGDRS